MDQSKMVKIVVFVPASHADAVRGAIGKAGAGVIGNYTYCSFTSRGVGRFRPENGAHPTIGKVGKFEAVEEDRVEVSCERAKMDKVIKAIKDVHPYEEMALDVYPIELV